MTNEAPHIADQYETPKVALIITHYNYSSLIEDALKSVLAQSYQNFECVIVDDCSEASEFKIVEHIVQNLNDERVGLYRNEKNLGQLGSFYFGLEQTSAEFVSMLDPDDRLAPNFLVKMLAVHLNGNILAPLACCDQYYYQIGYGVLGVRRNPRQFDQAAALAERERHQKFGYHRFVEPWRRGWYWTSTSSIMFRAACLKLLKPTGPLRFKVGADSYLANGAHMLGGTLILNDPLVYRGNHGSNAWLSKNIHSTYQIEGASAQDTWSRQYRRDLVGAFLENGGLEVFPLSYLEKILFSQFEGLELVELVKDIPQLAEVLADAYKVN